MKILVVSSRYPARGQKGDQSRSYSYVTRLAERHDLTVVTAGAPEAGVGLPKEVEVISVPGAPARRVAGAVWAAARGRPVQVGAMMPARTWCAAMAAAHRVDVALVNTARSMRGALPVPCVVDHVDALSLNMLRRSAAAPAVARRLAAAEAARMRRWEGCVASWAAAQIVTSAADAAALPGHPLPRVVPVGWEIAAVEQDERDIDVLFTGNMAYGPNRDAAIWLAQQIAPAVRARRPDVQVAIAGRDAGQLRLPGVKVYTDVEDPASYLARAKVAIAPLRRGTGSPYKVIEAAACGAAVVGTAEALRPFGLESHTADTAAGLAAAVLDLLEHPETLATAQRASAAVAERHTAVQMSLQIEEILLEVCSSWRPRSTPYW